MNFWAIAFPCLMYLTSFGTCQVLSKPKAVLSTDITNAATGITAAYYQASQQYTKSISLGIPYFSSSISLNILLTIMIVIRLVLRRRDLRNAVGPLFAPNKLYKTVITILVESCALYAVGSILNIGPWCTNNPLQFAFFPILVQTQVRTVIFIFIFSLLLHFPNLSQPWDVVI
jgi:hypothetical protein